MLPNARIVGNPVSIHSIFGLDVSAFVFYKGPFICATQEMQYAFDLYSLCISALDCYISCHGEILSGCGAGLFGLPVFAYAISIVHLLPINNGFVNVPSD